MRGVGGMEKDGLEWRTGECVKIRNLGIAVSFSISTTIDPGSGTHAPSLAVAFLLVYWHRRSCSRVRDSQMH